MKNEKKSYIIFNNIKMALLSILWKRDKSIVILGAWFGEKFADNTRYLYQYLSDNKKEFGLTHVVWVTRNKKVNQMLTKNGYESYMMDSKESVYYHKKAYFHIICNGSGDMYHDGDLLGKYSYGAKRINLWHGNGNKRTGWLSNNHIRSMQNKNIKIMLYKWLNTKCYLYRNLCTLPGGWENRYLVSTSNAMKDVFMKSFNIPNDKIILSGYARNCPCPHLFSNEVMILEHMKKYKHTVLYLPTFRQDDSFSVHDVSIALQKYILKNNILLIQKKHSVDKMNELTFGSGTNIINLDKNFDINVLLPHVDLLITDYSSVMSDALYHEKKIVFYVPDFEHYKNGANGLIFNSEDVMCGPFVFNVNQLEYEVDKCLNEKEYGKSKNYTEAKKMYWPKEYSLRDIWLDICTQVEKRGR